MLTVDSLGFFVGEEPMSTLGEILYDAVDGSFAIDSKQRVIYWDKGCEELLGYPEQWALGRPCCDILKAIHPTSGKAYCSPDCHIAKLANNCDGPKNFNVNVNDSQNHTMNLSVNIVLIPSACKTSWHVMHLLHRATFPDVLSALDRRNSNLNANTEKRHHLKLRRTAETAHVLDHDSISRLTHRELEILKLLSEGVGNTAIATRLSISSVTVRNHIQHIQKKLGVHSKMEAVAYAYRHQYT